MSPAKTKSPVKDLLAGETGGAGSPLHTTGISMGHRLSRAGDLLDPEELASLTAICSETTPKERLPAGDIVRGENGSVTFEPPAAPVPAIPEKMPLFNHDYTAKRTVMGPKRLYQNWNPPLLGPLPDDFLRLSGTPEPKSTSRALSPPSGSSSQPLLGMGDSSQRMRRLRQDSHSGSTGSSSSPSLSPRPGSMRGTSPGHCVSIIQVTGAAFRSSEQLLTSHWVCSCACTL